MDPNQNTSPPKILKTAIRFLAIAAGFFLITRSGHSIKVFDLLVAILGILVVLAPDTRRLLGELLTKVWPYLKYLILLVILILLAQLISYLKSNNTTLESESLVNYGRVVFNIFTLLTATFIVYYDRKILLLLSISIFVSSSVNLPAFWNLSEGVHISGGRLTGFLQTPLILGLWLNVIFLIGLGLYTTTKKTWSKIFLIVLLVVTASFSLWSASRAAWLALAFALFLWILFYIWEKEWKKFSTLILVSVIVFLFGYLLLPHEQIQMKTFVRNRVANLTKSVVTLKPNEVQAQSQTRIWPGIAGFILRHPFGSGFGSYHPKELEIKNGTSVSNNSFLELGLYGGIGAILIFMVFLLKLAGKTVSIIKKNRSIFSEIELVWLLAGVSVVVTIFFTDAFLWRHVWFALGIVLGIILIEHPTIQDKKSKPNLNSLNLDLSRFDNKKDKLGF